MNAREYSPLMVRVAVTAHAAATAHPGSLPTLAVCTTVLSDAEYGAYLRATGEADEAWDPARWATD